MKIKYLKPLLKHIIREVNQVSIKPVNEHLGTPPERDYNDPKVVAHSIYQPVYLTRFSYDDKDGGKVYEVLLFSPTGPKHAIKQDKSGKWFYLRDHDRKWVSADAYLTPPAPGKKVPVQPGKGSGALKHLDIGPLQEMIANKNMPPEPMGAVNVEEEIKDVPDSSIKKEQSVSGGAGAYSTPFAFKKKKIREVGSFESKVRSKVRGVSSVANEKTLPDGRYADNMLDAGRMKRAEGLNETSAVSFSEIPDKAHFRIPGYDNLFQKIDNDFARNHGTGGMLNKPTSLGRKGQKVKINHDTLVHIEGSAVQETTASGAVFSGGPTIQTPAWGTHNRLGSPKAIKASKNLGYKVVKSITDEKK